MTVPLQNGLSKTEEKIISDRWLAGIEIDETLARVMDYAVAQRWDAVHTAEKILAVRTRYMELDMIEIQQEMALRFMPEEEE